MELDIYEDEIEEHDDMMEEAAEEGKFFHFKDLNAEYYTPFMRNSSVYRPIREDGTMPNAIEWAEFFNQSTLNDERCFTELGLAYNDIKPQARSLARVPGGVYTYEPAGGQLYERLQVFSFIDNNEAIIPLGDTFEEVNTCITKFIANEAVYREVRTKYKLGLLLYGTPGQGKSVFIRALLKNLISNDNQDAVVIYMGSYAPSPNFLRKINTALKGRLKVFIFEELTTNLSSHYVNWLLTFLDGENSIDKSITIATTNYPEVLPENIVNRPSRFDKIFEFLPPNEKDRAELIKLFMSKDATADEIKATKDYSIADIKELCMSVRVNNLTLIDAVKVITHRKERCKKAFSKTRESQIGW